MIKKFLPFVLIVSVALTSCMSIDANGIIQEGNSIAPADGQVYAIHLRSTLHGMQQASRGALGTQLFRRGDLYTFVWNIKDGWGFATINTVSKSPIRDFAQIAKHGSFANTKTMGDLINCLAENGWRPIVPAALPTGVVSALEVSGSWLTTLAGSMTSFLVVPAGTLLTPPMLQEYAGIDT